jgi:exoribonuclease R
MKKYQIFIEDKNYSTWHICDEEQRKMELIDIGLPITFHPIHAKLFTKDIFIIGKNGEITIIHSHTRTVKELAGVLLLENNKTFGRTKNKKRLLYKCLPDDKYLPPFLIPYDVELGFYKAIKNKYIVFKYSDWDDRQPQAQLVHVLGDVDNLEVFYEYQLYCRSLHISLTDFNNKTRHVLNRKTNEEYISQIFRDKNYIIEDRRTQEYIFTIDPIGSLDYDDGFSIQRVGDKYKISVYIANVFFWMETFGLWKSFSRRISTIYLPDRRRPMLPTILSDSLCSLQEGQDRFAFVMDVIVDADGNIEMDSIHFANTIIRVSRNYEYENPKMLETDESYKMLFGITVKMDGYVKTSHDVVSSWMIHMNRICGEFMMSHKFGIFRSSFFLNKIENHMEYINHLDLCDETKRVIKNWNNVTGQYILYEENRDFHHHLMNIKSYVHITSPIRRLVDLLNQMEMIRHCGLVRKLSGDATQFLRGWLSEIEYINVTMRSIRKVQTNCELMHRCCTEQSVLDREHEGVVFDKIEKEEGFFSYMVYLEGLKMLSKIRCMTDVPNFTKLKFKVFIFEGEDKIKKKVRLHVLSGEEV